MTTNLEKQPNLTNQKIEYLKSISPQQPQTAEPTAPTPILSKKNKIILVSLFLVTILLIVIIILIGKKSNSILDYDSPNEFSPNYGAIPVEIIDDYKLNIENPDFSSATIISTMNANALNFFLDQPDAIVAIVEPSGISALDRESNIVFIYASVPPEHDYVGFFLSDFNVDGSSKDEWLLPEQTAIYFSQSELFDQLTSSAKYYLISKEE